MITPERGVDVSQANLHRPVQEGVSCVHWGMGLKRPHALSDQTWVEGRRSLGPRVQGQNRVEVRSAPKPLADRILAHGRPILPRPGP